MNKKRILLSVLPILLFTAVAIVWFFPVIRNFSTSVAGIGGDPYQTLWRFNRLGETVSQGSLFVPEEKSLPNLAPLPWLPVFYLFGDVVAYNTAWLVSAILAGYLCFVLARLWGAQFWPALVAGLLVEFAPYRIAQSLGHFGAMQFWVLLAVLICLTAWYRKNNLWFFLLGMLFSIWTAWTDHQLFIVLMIIIGVVALIYWRETIRNVKKTPLLVLIAVVMVCISVLPFARSIFTVSDNSNHFNLGGVQRDSYSATLRSVLLPAPFSLIGSRVYSFNLATDNVQALGVVLPVVVLVLFIVSNKMKKDVGFAILILLGLVLSFGASVSIRGINIPLPGKLLFELPILSSIRTIGRFVVLPVIFLPIYLAIKWVAKKNIYWFVIALFCLLEIIPIAGFPVLVIEHTKAKQVAENLGTGSVLAIPAYTNYQYGSEQLYYSLDYQKPVVGNSALSRIIDPKSLEEFLATPVIRDLVLLRLSDFDLPTIFGQANKDIVNLAFASQEIGNVLLETNPLGGMVSLEGNKQTTLDSVKIEQVKKYLRDSLGLKESMVGTSTFVYGLPVSGIGTAQYFVMEGKGWQIKKKLADRSVVELQKVSEFFVYSTENNVLDLSMTVLDSAGNSDVIMRSDQGEQRVSFGTNERINMELETQANKLVKYTLILDKNPILVENPRIK
ncbi:MAG: hypothetical protein Q7S57_02965 [bacterium]|nr:hypothetical protein [bacterium]